jgi:hypothetical protein
MIRRRRCGLALTWAADNGAFSQFDERLFLNMLQTLRGVPGCRFVAAPDVVGDAAQTLRLFDQWEPLIRSLGFPVALVGQDGLTVGAVPWSRIDAIFIGGSTSWKLSKDAAELVAYGQARGKWTHLGRANTRRRLHHASRIGCDSVDGTAFSRWPDLYIPKALDWLEPLPLFADHART